MATYSDDFNRADGSLGANWALRAGSISLKTNSASGQANSVAAYNASVAAAQAAECASSYLGPAVRIQGGGQCLAAWLEYDAGLDDGSASLSVARIAANGAVAALLRDGSSAGDGLAFNSIVRLEIEASGAFVAKVNGSPIYSGSFTTLTDGSVGMRSDDAGSGADNWSGGDLAEAPPQAATADWSGAYATAGASMAATVPQSTAAWAGAGVAAGASMGAVVPFAAAADWAGVGVSAVADFGASLWTPPQDDFNRPDSPTPGSAWAILDPAVPDLAAFQIVAHAAGGTGSARYTAGQFSASQGASVTYRGGSCSLLLRSTPPLFGGFVAPAYAAVFDGVSLAFYRPGTQLGALVSAPLAAGQEIKFEARSTPQGTTLQAFVGGALVGERLDSNPLPVGYPGLGGSHIDEYGEFLPFADDFRAWSLPSPAAATWDGAGVTAGASMGMPIGATAAWSGAGAVAGASMGQPVAATAAWAGASARAFAAPWSAAVSRLKANAITPEYAAWGGFDLFSAQEKGKLTANGDRSIGGRKQMNGGDRWFVRVAHEKLLTGDAGAVARADLRFTVTKCMSASYLAAGAAASPSGSMFDVRPVTSALDLATGDGMEATLGDAIGSVPAAPIWRGGQPGIDGVTLGNPIREVVVDITAAYNAAIVAGDLLLCLECKLSDPAWIAELYGVEPDAPELSPRIEVHRWGEVPIAVDTDSCEPSVTVGALPAGATIARIQWGYDPKLTSPGGSLKYATKPAQVFDWLSGEVGGLAERPGTPLPEGSAWRYSVPTDGLAAQVTVPSTVRLPMVQASSRVYLEVEIDYGAAKGALLFKRSWVTPSAPKPNLRAPQVTHYPEWLEVRGPFPALPSRVCDRWGLWVKRTFPAWQPNHVYPEIGEVVISPLNGTAWCVAVPGTSGSSCPLSSTATPLWADRTTDGSAQWIRSDVFRRTYAAGAPYWQLWGCADWEGSPEIQGHHRWFPVLGGPACDPNLGKLGWGPDALYPSPVPRFGLLAGDVWAGLSQFATSLPLFDFDDISPIGNHTAWHAGFFLYSKQNGARWDVGLMELISMGEGGESWFASATGGGYTHRDHGVLYTADGRPDLSKSAAFFTMDWRSEEFFEFDQSICVAFVVTGPPYDNPAGASAERLIVLSRSDFWKQNKATTSYIGQWQRRLPLAAGDGNRAPYPWDYPLPGTVGIQNIFESFWNKVPPLPDAWTKEVDVPVSGVVSLDAMHCLTADRALYSVLAARTASGTGWLGSRSQNVRTMLDGGGSSFTLGTWATATPANWKKAWVSEPALPNPDMPDFATASVVLQDASGLRLLRPDTLAVQEPAAGVALLPATDWSTATTWNRSARIARRLPMDGQVSRLAHGGGLVVASDGATLKVQGMNDLCRVSEIATFPLPSAIQSIHVQKSSLWEGEPNPIVTKHADGYRSTIVVPHVDQCRLDTPTEDMRVRFRSGKLTLAHFVADQPNIHHRGLVHLPGHNTFALTYKWDTEMHAFVEGLMNHCGWLLAHLRGEGIAGERVRLIITQSPAFGGMWWDVNDNPDNPDRRFYPADPLQGYNPEAIGGDQYPLMMHASWYYSTDYLNWRSVPDVDYVLDGETHGGAYVVSLTLPADEAWISKEIVSDIRTYKTLLAQWKAAAPSLVRSTTSEGELELPVSGGILSQMSSFPAP